MDYEKLIHALIDPIVEEPKSVLIRVNDSEEKDITILIAGKSENKHVHIRFESFDEEKEED